MVSRKDGAPGGGLRFGERALQLNLRFREAARLGGTQSALLTALEAVSELLTAPRLPVELTRYDDDGLDLEPGPALSVPWPGRDADLRPRVEAMLAEHGATPLQDSGLALGTLGPLTARRVRIALPPGAAIDGLSFANEQGEALPGRVVPAAALPSGPSVWLESPSTDLCSGFLLRVSGPGDGRVELTLGNLLLDPHRDGRGDDDMVLGAPLSAWRAAARAHLERVEGLLRDHGWHPSS